MKQWLKRIGLATIGASLLASVTLVPEAKDVQAQTQQSAYFGNKLGQAAAQQTNPSTLSSDTLVIKFTSPITPAEHRLAGATLVKQFSDLHYAVVKVNGSSKLSTIIANYQRYSSVVSVTPSAVYQPLSIVDPKAGIQYQNNLLQLAKAQGLAGKNNVIVAVIDQGIDQNHPDLKGRLLPSYNAVNPMNQGQPDFHGTHVAGIIAADKDNGLGGYGVNPNAKLLPIDVFNRKAGAPDYAIADGILYAISHGAKVINMSLGSSMPSPLIEAAIKRALAKNVVVVAAAGNTGDAVPQYPAAYEGVISVGSINAEKKRSSFSTYGTSLDVVAPGEGIYSTIYDLEKKSTYRTLSGTSMATPMVSGTVSLLLAKYPKLTPAQVEYILKHTAQDLGTAGYDIYYGYGLINPVAALNFNMKNLPALALRPWSEKEILEKSSRVNLNGKTTVKGTITKPFEEKWYKTEVKKGDHLQFVLSGASSFDYKLLIRMNSTNQMIEVNNAREGEMEGKLYTAPADGMVLFAVKDVNGCYDDSAKQLSSFTLTVEKRAVLPADESTYDQPVPIDLPFVSTTNRLLGADGDDDYYSFSVKERKAISITLGALAGVDTSISVFTADQLVPPPLDDEEEDGASEFDPANLDPAFYANSGTAGEDESLTFMADADVKYVIMVSNKKFNNYGIYDYFQNPGMMTANQQPESSMEAYKLKVDGKILPEDEDMFPISMISDPEKSLNTGGTVDKSLPADPADDQFIAAIMDGSLEYNIGETAGGYLQTPDDEDWFAVTPEETAIYKFAFGKSVPAMSVFKITQQMEGDGKVYSYLDQVGTNISWNNGQTTPSFYTGLKKDETYFIKISGSYLANSISFDPYQFTVKEGIRNPFDVYEDNDSLEKVTKVLPSKAFEANFAQANDVDAFYLQAKESQIYGVTFSRKVIDAKWRSKYPAELINTFTGTISVVEDTNKNHRLDSNEYDKMITIDNTTQNGTTYGSFKVEKNKNYIVIVTSQIDAPVPLTLWPYIMKVTPVNTKDEDRGSIVKNNTPSKPLALKASGKNQLAAAGYLNAGVANGDEDWYVLKLPRDAKGRIELSSGVEVDGTISLYSKGKMVALSDAYAEGDAEVLQFSLKKGTYYIKVRDVNGNASVNPYQLTVKY